MFSKAVTIAALFEQESLKLYTTYISFPYIFYVFSDFCYEFVPTFFVT